MKIVDIYIALLSVSSTLLIKHWGRYSRDEELWTTLDAVIQFAEMQSDAEEKCVVPMKCNDCWYQESDQGQVTRNRHMNTLTPSILTDTKGLGRDDWTKCWDNLNFISLILHGAGCWSMNNPQNKTTCHWFATDTDITHIQTYFAVTFCHFISKPDFRFPPHWKLKCCN